MQDVLHGVVMSNLCKINGVTTVTLSELVDEHGAVLHMLRNDAPDFMKFGECYFSEVLPGAIKAWKLHRKQTQNLAVPVGRVKLVIYDDRVGSRTRHNLEIHELGRPDAYLRVKIPPGLWYGFACKGHAPALLANCTDLPHDPTESDRKPPFDKSIPYDWRN
jgi:dTDP-4-dehydrorhamnose 3,5-epimerase